MNPKFDNGLASTLVVNIKNGFVDQWGLHTGFSIESRARLLGAGSTRTFSTDDPSAEVWMWSVKSLNSLYSFTQMESNPVASIDAGDDYVMHQVEGGDQEPKR